MAETPLARRRLILLRHAKAAPAESALADFARPLTERGESDARKIGARLAERHAPPRLIVASPALRARRTAEIVATALGCATADIVFDARLYLADVPTILAVIGEQDPTLESLLVVGHNPGLSDAARELAPALPLAELPTTGVATLDCAALTWRELARTQATLRYCDFPASLATPVRID